MSELEYRPFRRWQLWLYDLVLWLFSVIFDCFFREIRPRGAFRVPKMGPVIFVAAPHANQFVDPLVLLNQVRREAHRRILFLIATKSYNHPVIGRLSSAQLAIPVSRAQDMLTPGTGTITVDFKEPHRVRGENTRFTTECMVRGLLALPQSLGASEIADIISDTELVLKKPFEATPKIERLLARGTRYKVARKIDQKKVYEYVFKHLSAGGCLGIFPEGGSHDRTELLPLKAGVAVMALGAMAGDPNCNVQIVPCGMNYFHAHKFRSRAVVEFGHPILISPELVKRYSDAATSKEAVRELLDTIFAGLKAVTVTCNNYETLMVIQAARRLYAGNFAQHLPLPMVVEMNRRLVLGYETFKHLPQMAEIRSEILRYNKTLKHLHMADHHVEECDETVPLRVFPRFVATVLKLLMYVTLALPGAILFLPVFALAKYVSLRKKKTALANSTVKIKANDVVATWKILISMGAAPLLYLFYALVGLSYCKSHGYLQSLSLPALWFSLYLLGVLVTYCALVTGEQGADLFKSLRPMWLLMILRSAISDLKRMRMKLSNDITEFVNTYGLELFPDDFNLLEIASADEFVKPVDYDSDEAEELITMELRNRRKQNRRRRKSSVASTASDGTSRSDSESSTSDGLSSTHSFTNIPMFSDYALHMNAKNPEVDIKSVAPSALPSSMSISDDFNYGNVSEKPISREDSLVELNFANRARRESADKLSSKIQLKIREARAKEL